MNDEIMVDLAEAKQNVKEKVKAALKRLGLWGLVSLEEIEKELLAVETAFKSLLILGILSRAMDRRDDEAAKLFIPAITEWKNYLPHQDLAGLSPAEYREKYPPGPQEALFIAGLLKEYETRLVELGRRGRDPFDFDVEADFAKFQEEYFNRVPSDQLFAGKLLTVREIIVAERRQNNHPADKLEKIGVKLFSENTAEGAGRKIAEIEDAYFEAMKELETMRTNPKLRSRRRVRELRRQLERDEPYHRGGPAPHQFYFNYAMVVFLDEENIKPVISFLDRALRYEPNYSLAREMKRRLKAVEI